MTADESPRPPRPPRRTPLGALRITHRSEAPPAVPPDALTFYAFHAPALGAALDTRSAEVGRPALAAWWAAYLVNEPGAVLVVPPDTTPAALVATLRDLADEIDRGGMPGPSVAAVWDWRRAHGCDTHESLARPGVLPPPTTPSAADDTGDE